MKNIFILLIIPFVSISQNTRKVFIETGISFYKPFINEERLVINAQTMGNADLKYIYKTTPGYFIKCGIEMLYKPDKRFNVSVPVSIGYKEFNKTIIQEGYAYGCFSNFNGIQKTQIFSKSASIMIGPKFNFRCKKVIIFTALNINTDLFFVNSEITEYKPIHTDTYKYFKSNQPPNEDFMFSSSLQLGFDYKLSNRWTIGLSSDCYFFNFNPMIDGGKLNNKLFNMGFGKQSLFICSGIRTSFSF